MYSCLLTELRGAASRFEYHDTLQDQSLSQVVTTLAHEIEGGFADRILVETLDTALCIRIAQRFVGHLSLATSEGLSPQRLQRVRDGVEAHLDEDLSLTVLADIACLSPYHFSRSFKQAARVGPQRYVTQRRFERAKTLLRRTTSRSPGPRRKPGLPTRAISSSFRREIGMTPSRLLKKRELCGFLVAEGLTMSDYDERSMRC